MERPKKMALDEKFREAESHINHDWSTLKIDNKTEASLDLAGEVQTIKPRIAPSPLSGFEYVRGYGVFALPFDTGHVLALRVFPENDFAPYSTIWHCSPEGVWSIFADTPRLDIACPRYYSAAAAHNIHANISLNWTGPMTLSIEVDAPRLEWCVSMTTTPLVKLVNAVSQGIPERFWRRPLMLKAFEHIADLLFDLGDVTLSGNAPNGHFAKVMPIRMFPVGSATARLNNEDLGQPTRSKENPSIGALRLPARPVFAIGRAYFEMQDPDEYRQTVAELSS
ncbi:hypothetical protein [Fodinibius salsisoli]|uniref:Acetoacetate decarboxylase (ADC) n=1 Tax=Fodinibius salsisoli TaxID=2820877 RepID=A0ABT3PJJ8_9BACT|nr:hypothetical protein [Fodinibius salsisoli]MCW9706111.1 hypothetical protein [Fodinibius salsisoli]